MEICIEKLSDEAFKKRNISSWPIWEKEVSKFDWQYDATEECFFISGKVVITTENGKAVYIKSGDFVVFPKGLSCVWDIKKQVKKYYNFVG